MGTFKKCRDWLQQLIYKIIDPSVRGMIKIGITPNIVTAIGFLLNIVAACVFVYAGLYSDSDDYTNVGIAGGIILFAGLFDMLDGQVARIGGMSSTFGALFDSVLDRYSELFTFFGITVYFIFNLDIIGVVLSLLALMGSLMVSYVRARAEGLGLDCKVGLMQRPERVVLTALGALLCGILAPVINPESGFSPIYIFIIPIAIIALLSNVTAIARMKHCYKQLNHKQ